MSVTAVLRGPNGKVTLSESDTLILGRKKSEPSKEEDGERKWIVLSNDKKISRKHAKLFYNPNTSQFEIKIYGKNGVQINEAHLGEGTASVPHQAVLQIGESRFTFEITSPTGRSSPTEKTKSRKRPREEVQESSEDEGGLVIDEEEEAEEEGERAEEEEEDDDEDEESSDSDSDRKKKKKKKRRKKDSAFDDLPTPNGWNSASSKNGEGTGTRKRKRHANSVKSYTPAPRTPEGALLLPINIGGLSVLKLGTIAADRKKFHAKRYIWPIGFKSTRVYPSMQDPAIKCVYTSEIVDGGEEPKFLVTPEGSDPIVASTPSGAWTEVVKRVNSLKLEKTGKRLFTTVSGPEMFGFSHPTIAQLIQELPGAELCEKYVFQEFIPKAPVQRKRKKASGESGGQTDVGELGDAEMDIFEEEIEEEAGVIGEQEHAIESNTQTASSVSAAATNPTPVTSTLAPVQVVSGATEVSKPPPRVQFARPTKW